MLSSVSSPTSDPAPIDYRQRRQPAGAQALERLLEAQVGDTLGTPAVMASATVDSAPRWDSPRIRLSRVRIPSVRPRLSTTGNSRCSPLSSSSHRLIQRRVDRDGAEIRDHHLPHVESLRRPPGLHRGGLGVGAEKHEEGDQDQKRRPAW